jgi:hypothetical protein
LIALAAARAYTSPPVSDSKVINQSRFFSNSADERFAARHFSSEISRKEATPVKKAGAYRPDERKGAVYSILFGEPYNLGNDGKVFKVTWDFYKILKKKPKVRKSNAGNAYIFGRHFPWDEYKHVGSHGNDGAQTGFIDLTGASRVEIQRLRSDEAWHDIYGAVDYDWDNSDALKAIRKQLSERILFVGETVGGDVGADLYLHKDSNGHVDGAIIDNNYIFHVDDDDD